MFEVRLNVKHSVDKKIIIKICHTQHRLIFIHKIDKLSYATYTNFRTQHRIFVDFGFTYNKVTCTSFDPEACPPFTNEIQNYMF